MSELSLNDLINDVENNFVWVRVVRLFHDDTKLTLREMKDLLEYFKCANEKNEQICANAQELVKCVKEHAKKIDKFINS